MERFTPCTGIGCPNLVRIPDGAPVPDGGAFCIFCDQQARDSIARNLAQMTGNPRGGIALVDGELVAWKPA